MRWLSFPTPLIATVSAAALSLASPLPAQEVPSELDVRFEIPEVIGTGASLDDDTLLSILSGDIAAHAAELAALEAESIVVPRISFTLIEPEGDTISIVYEDLVLSDVSAGIAQSVAMGGSTVEFNDEVRGTLGSISAHDFNIGGLLAFYGLVPHADTETFQTIYRDVRFTGGTISGGDMSCVIGGAEIGEFSARPMSVSILDIVSLAGEMEAAGTETPDPEVLRRIFAFYAEMLGAFQSSSSHFEGLRCKGQDQDGAAVAFSLGPVTIDAFTPGRYPALRFETVVLSVESPDLELDMSYRDMVFKGFDYSNLTQTLARLADLATFDTEALEENLHMLMPAFEGFGFADFSMRVLDRTDDFDMSLAVREFDLTLADYVGAVPTTVTSHAYNVVLDWPGMIERDAAEMDEALALLRSLGVEGVDLSYRLALDIDPEAGTLALEPFAIKGENLGALALFADLSNLTPELFSGDEAAMAAAVDALAINRLRIEAADSGIVELVAAIAAEEEGIDPREMRTVIANEVEGGAAAFFIGSGANIAIAQALGAFLQEGREFVVSVTARDPAGLAVSEFAKVEDNIFALFAIMEKLEVRVGRE